MVALAATVVLRLFYSISANFIPLARTASEAFIASNLHAPGELMAAGDGWPYRLWGIWQRFDSISYLHIAAHGYDSAAVTVFYPFFPALIRVCGWITGQPWLSALAISTAATFFLFWGLQKLIMLDLPWGIAVVSIGLLAAFPASFIFFAAYPDSLVIALMVWSIYFARRENWWAAGALGFLAGLTKAVGGLVAIPLVILIWRERRWRALPAPILSVLSFPAFQLWIRHLGFPSVSETYARDWGTVPGMPWDTLSKSIAEVAHTGNLLLEMNLAAIALVAACVAAGAVSRKIRLEYAVFSAAAITVFLTKQTTPILQSTMRYSLAVFPAFVLAARALHGRWILAVLGLLLFGANFILFGIFLGWGLVV